MDLEVISAFCLMPFAMVVAAQGWTWAFAILSSVPLLLILYYYNKFMSQSKTKFFLGWSVVTFFFLFAVFELEVVPYLEILFSENLCLMCCVAAMCFCFFIVKSNSQPASQTVLQNEKSARIKCETCTILQPVRTLHCDLCGFCVLKKDHHNAWLDVCIGSRNQKYFIGGLVFLLISCVYSSNLTLTTICHPTLVAGILLMPDDCTDVFDDFHIAICFVSAVYTLMIAVFCSYLLLQQLWFVCHNATYQDWKDGNINLYNNGIRRNIIDFWYGYY
ncbi:palmitoyltransferase ZDHHC23-A [Parasteatoda tepidariorum]|uniref:palmitoyltransferase ZDHHC23-A n=1 Tax=Parasteatoda tepidariorum TaxID=114398 RepID=UPI00077FAE88|nr:palmitoyltransferase ZDHHC23-A [Parasteatoda tepidariorum]